MSAIVTTAAHSFLKNHKPGSGRLEKLLSSVGRSLTARRDWGRLAELDERLLRDIGIATDEVPLVRAGVRFTPRQWAQRKGR